MICRSWLWLYSLYLESHTANWYGLIGSARNKRARMKSGGSRLRNHDEVDKWLKHERVTTFHLEFELSRVAYKLTGFGYRKTAHRFLQASKLVICATVPQTAVEIKDPVPEHPRITPRQRCLHRQVEEEVCTEKANREPSLPSSAADPPKFTATVPHTNLGGRHIFATTVTGRPITRKRH